MNKKIKIISETSEKTFEYTVNDFLKTHKAIDIQYQLSGSSTHGYKYSAMIVYEEW